jgi:membrane dipeptidase
MMLMVRRTPEQDISKPGKPEVMSDFRYFSIRAPCSMWIAIALLTVMLIGGACGDDEIALNAQRIALETLIVDTHVDIPDRLDRNPEDISVRTETGHFDYVRSKAGGLDAAFMSIYVSEDIQEAGGAKAHAEKLIDMVKGFEAKWPEKFAVARSTQDVVKNFERGVISLPMGMENGAPIEDDLSNVGYFYDRGIRYITLTHSKNNQICDSSYDEEDTWVGLSPFGRVVVAEMNRYGVMIDISHVSDEAFYEVIELSKTPVIASHSSCRHFTPGFERNMDDDMIRTLANNGGVIQINFGSGFLDKLANEQTVAAWDAVDTYLKENGLVGDGAAYEEQMDRYWADHPRAKIGIGHLAEHFDHVVSIAGIDHVGIGSDFDGVTWLPTDLEDTSMFPNLIAELLQRGYSEEDLTKILSANLMRVWSEVEQYAAEQP